MQLSSRILTALAVLILAVAVLSVRAGDTETVEAATGTIDVLNVGTCYTTDDGVFTKAACKDGELDADTDDTAGNDADNSYKVAGRDAITEVDTVYATYAHDPKTAADNPRGILHNSNLIKISVSDPGRDTRTPVLLGVGNTEACLYATKPTAGPHDNDTPDDTTDDKTAYVDDRTTCLTNTNDSNDLDDNAKTYYDVHLPAIQKDYPGIAASANDFRWDDDSSLDAYTVTATGSNNEAVIDGIAIQKNGVTADYDPMYVVEEAGKSPISIYGTYDSDGARTDCLDTDGTTAISCPAVFMKLNPTHLYLDEDVGSGRVAGEVAAESLEVAPWFSVQNRVSTHGVVVVMYVVYQTSDFETLIGGAKKGDAAYKAPTTGTPWTDLDGVYEPVYTDDETATNNEKALVVKASSDGVDRDQNLVLKETSRFSGRYEGYLRLTNADGDAGTGEDPRTQNNWGLQTMHASTTNTKVGSMGGAAVLGVDNDPVTITYKDTDGKTQTHKVEIDIVPPNVVIDAPVHKSEGQDTSPEFAGSFTDADSGIRKDSFRLWVDHTDDTNENGIAGDPALKLAVNTAGSDYGTVAGTDDVVESHSDYVGHPGDGTTDDTNRANEPEFGVIPQAAAFELAKTSTTGTGDDAVTRTVRKVVEEDPLTDGAKSGTFADSLRITFLGTNDYNNTLDFQAVVADRAGNIGFSDSDPDGPRFINNLGEKKDKQKPEKYNVLGWYARHVFFLDETDPAIFEEQTVTGFYGENDDDVPQPSRSGILVAFDRAVDPDSIDVGTFSVTLDPVGDAAKGEAATVTDVDPQGKLVYLKLAEELASDATPLIDVATGEWVADPAGNRLTGGDVTAFDAKDGISPIITVTLSGGSGTGEGSEGPSMLTKNSIVATISSDEEIYATPYLVVVCSNMLWDTDTTDKDDERTGEVADLEKKRSGALSNASANFDSITFDCGTEPAADAKDRKIQQTQSYTKPGLEWEYQWVDFTDEKSLPDGKLTVLAYARDPQSYAGSKGSRKIGATALPADTYNWGAGTSEFRFDTMLDDPTPKPAAGGMTTEARPFVLLNYDDASTVSVSEFKIDGTVQEVQVLGDNRFLYWPESLSVAEHSVSTKAVDAAGNEDTFTYKFTVAERKAFNLKLIAGWNAVSFPANPIDPMIENVFTDPVVDMVAAWDTADPSKPWSIATKMGGEWSTNGDMATLTKVTAKYGYWVHAQGFTTQRVQLVGGIDRVDSSVVPPDLVSIPTLTGWNFVGVIDQDGDQTQANWGEVLKTGTTSVTALDYLGMNAIKSYTWDSVRNRFDTLEPNDTIKVGQGIWVYFAGENMPPGIAP